MSFIHVSSSDLYSVPQRSGRIRPGHPPHTGVLGQVLPDQSVGVFVGPPLPRAVGLAEVHRHAHLCGELLMAGHLRSAVIRQRQPHVRRQLAESGLEGLPDCLSVGTTGACARRFSLWILFAKEV